MQPTRDDRERAKKLRKLILDSTESLATLLHREDLRTLIEVCRNPGALSASRQGTCREEVLFRLLKGGEETAKAVLDPDTGILSLSKAENARLLGLLRAANGTDFYANRARYLIEFKRLAETAAETKSFRSVLEAAIRQLEQDAAGSGSEINGLQIRVLLQNRSAEGIPGWVADLQVGGPAAEDTRIGKAFLHAAREGLAAAARWVRPYATVNALNPDAHISLIEGRWPEQAGDDSGAPQLDYGSCFLPFAVAGAFHACGLRLPTWIGLTGAAEGGRVTSVDGIDAKLKAAGDAGMYSVYAVSGRPIPSPTCVKHIEVDEGPVREVLNKLARDIGDELAQAAAPTLLRHLPPPYVSPSFSPAIDAPIPLPATLCTPGGPQKMDLNCAWGLDRTEWLGIVQAPPTSGFPHLLTSLMAFETALYEHAQSFSSLPPVPARWWMPISCERTRNVSNLQQVWAAADEAWCTNSRLNCAMGETRELTPMELLRRFSLDRAVVPGFIVTVPQAATSALVATLVIRLFELALGRDLAVIVDMRSERPQAADELAAAFSKCMPHVRSEIARAADEDAPQKPRGMPVPVSANRQSAVWKALFAQPPSAELMDMLLGQYEQHEEDVWRRAIFGFCGRREFAETGADTNEDRRIDVHAARWGRRLPWKK